jgi:uncharacterized protein YutE (UPF0331/DUF86 family)
MTVDRELVTRKLLLIARDLDQLQAIAAKDAASFLGSEFDQAVAERLLERMIGRMIDVNYHLLTESGNAPPFDYHASFLRLVEIKVLDPDFASRIARCAGLRNRLVHEYEEIDPRKVFEAVHSAREDIVAYLGAVQEHLQGLGPPEP